MIYNDSLFENCKTEQQFKMLWLKEKKKKLPLNVYPFCIETEETVKGFPDVMILDCRRNQNVSVFYEFKISDSNGKIKFQPTQPAFYRKYNKMLICVVALDKKNNKVHLFSTKELFNKNSPYFMNEKAEVKL